MYMPHDIEELIYQHYSVQVIQSHVRRWFVSHTRRLEWKRLLALLCSAIGSNEYTLLQSSRLVRREWRTEPTSWIATLSAENTAMVDICEEVKEGLWR
jgi:hypothetical protein